MDKQEKLNELLKGRPPDGPLIKVDSDGTFTATPKQIRELLEETLGDSLGDEDE